MSTSKLSEVMTPVSGDLQVTAAGKLAKLAHEFISGRIDAIEFYNRTGTLFADTVCAAGVQRCLDLAENEAAVIDDIVENHRDVNTMGLDAAHTITVTVNIHAIQRHLKEIGGMLNVR